MTKSCKAANEAARCGYQFLYWLAENLSSRAPTPLQWTAKLALLPMAATGRGGPPRPPPSERQDTWGKTASYAMYKLYTGVGGWGKQMA